MSGGSYNYLCYKYADEIEQQSEHLDDMIDRLTQLGWTKELAQTQQVVDKIDEFKKVKNELQLLLNNCSDVWRAIEWHDSCDGSELFDQLAADYAKQKSG